MNELAALGVVALGAIAITANYAWPAWYKFAKPLPLLFLIAWTALAYHSGELMSVWILVGLVCGLVGDLFLLKKKLFLVGLGFFLAGHVCYVVALIPATPLRATLVLPTALFGMAFSGVLFYFLWRSGRKQYLLPVLLYVLTICAMVVNGIQFDLDRYGTARAFAVGAVLFAVSDSLLSINRFVRPFTTGQLVVLSSYYAAQLCIAFGARLS